MCRHHRAVFAGLSRLGKIPDDILATMRADLAKACCDHPRPTRDR